MPTLLSPRMLAQLVKRSSLLSNLSFSQSSVPLTSAVPSSLFQGTIRCLCVNTPASLASGSSSLSSPLSGQTDRHGGVTVDLNELPANLDSGEFLAALTVSLHSWRAEGTGAVWLKIPIYLGHLISVAASQGFQYHHAEGSQAMLKLWLPNSKPDPTPQFATHQLGVSGVVVREDTRELLVVQDKNRPFTLWKFPGGLANLGEDIASTAVREVFEETGVETEFQSVLAFRQQHTLPGAFGRSDLYFLCRLRPLTYELCPCKEEIRQCCWMTVEQLRREVDKSSITVRVTDLVLRGLDEGFDIVDIISEQHMSVYKGLKFNMFFRPLPDARRTV